MTLYSFEDYLHWDSHTPVCGNISGGICTLSWFLLFNYDTHKSEQRFTGSLQAPLCVKRAVSPHTKRQVKVEVIASCVHGKNRKTSVVLVFKICETLFGCCKRLNALLFRFFVFQHREHRMFFVKAVSAHCRNTKQSTVGHVIIKFYQRSSLCRLCVKCLDSVSSCVKVQVVMCCGDMGFLQADCCNVEQCTQNIRLSVFHIVSNDIYLF